MSESSGRKVYYLAAVAIVAMVLISAVAVTRPFTREVGVLSNNPSGLEKVIQVTGTGTVSAAPDRAILLLAVTTQAANAADATAQNAAAMAKVLDALQGMGISKDSIQTVSYTLTPIYENKPETTAPPAIIGYMARNAIQVTLQGLSSVGKALDLAVSAGANEVQGVMFSFSSDTFARLQKQALQQAIQDADAQAKAVASGLGVSIIGPVSVTPGYSYVPVAYEKFTAGQSTPVQAGTLQVTATVQVSYAFA